MGDAIDTYVFAVRPSGASTMTGSVVSRGAPPRADVLSQWLSVERSRACASTRLTGVIAGFRGDEARDSSAGRGGSIASRTVAAETIAGGADEGG